MPGVRVLHGYTRDDAGADLDGYFAPRITWLRRWPNRTRSSCAVRPRSSTRCGGLRPDARSESFVPPVFAVPAEATGGTVTFAGSAVKVTDSGQTLLQQAEAAGLNPESGCRMGICFSCTRTKTRGAVRNVLNGTVSTDDCEDIRICVTAPRRRCRDRSVENPEHPVTRKDKQ